jgi:large subunit ribosomal protein L24
MKLKKGDEIMIVSGKDKGRKGKVEKTDSKKDQVTVLGLNLFKKHMKKRDEKNPGGIIDFPRPLGMGKVMLVCPKCKKPTRVGYSMIKKEKMRICKKCQQMI